MSGFALLARERCSWNIAAPDFSCHATPLFFGSAFCLLGSSIVSFKKMKTFDDVGILDTLRITLGGFARNTWLADRTRQCVSRPLVVIIQSTQEGVLVFQNVFCSGSFCWLVSTRKVFHVVCCVFLFRFIVCVSSRCRDCCIAEFSPSQFQ